MKPDVIIDGLFNNTARDVIAFVGLALAVFQTVVSLRFSRAAVSAGGAVSVPDAARPSAWRSFGRIAQDVDVRRSWRLFWCCALLTVIFSFVVGSTMIPGPPRGLMAQLERAEAGSGGVLVVLLAASVMFQSINLFGWVSGTYLALDPQTCNARSWTGFISAVSATYMITVVCVFRFADSSAAAQIFALTQMFAVSYALVLGLIFSALGWFLFKFFP